MKSMRFLLLIVCTLLVSACAVANLPTPTAPVVPGVSLGFPGNPVTRNAFWVPAIDTFDGIDMLLVPVGCFMMGSDTGDLDERPVNAQCFNQPFWIDRFEVTNAAFERLGGRAAAATDWPEPNRPRTSVTWLEARDFCASRGSRLPTEAEWEYAARGPDSTTYPWGNDFALDYGVYQGNSGGQSAEVGSRGPGMSWVGAMDMSGNLWEWVNTIYEPVRFTYPYTADDGRENVADTISLRVIRGVSWYDGNDYYARVSNRGRLEPDKGKFNIGFRCVRDY